ncbi:5-(carboxyamino)imidazole ribonucleotide synthase [Corynebacterium heidelbergense]|uniref:N5-carboxyaminoimidazole ribonucleotide synthase n=1 Tax=Corynebacterium heidelbergense TaxID=2055947 RepID=A0A364VDS9_9CORY|nr:5-(carboxyamino)imidazole ribonucleotide synthase [Corynebacterium heidelbergense]RAV34805.1 5-(carboxyamino)imidazole ribonucleotide synthase [Corynebacterium heidelbergense]WCZ37222.1 N5-carboxyaminoimidazole ribonucleotide synthase [Corynebacterium heidelbergense]
MTSDKTASTPSPDFRFSRSSAHAPGAPVLAIVGDGQLARMMQQAAIELGLSARVLAGRPDASAAQVAADVVLGDYRNRDHVDEVAKGADAVTFDHEHVPNEYLDELIGWGVNVQPQPAALIHAQDKLVMRKKLREIGAPVPPFLAIESVADVQGFYDATNGAVCVKSRRGGYDGKGVWFPQSRQETAELVERLLAEGVELLAEKKVNLVRELSAMVTRSPSGKVASWPVVESVQRDGICVEAVAPAPARGGDVIDAAEQLARMIVVDLGVTGVLAVELFETVDEFGQPELIVNELAMRPHNTGHWTQDGCVTSQFEQHVRAVLDRPLGDTRMTAPCTVMANVLGGSADPEMPMHERMDEVWRRFPGAKIHMYGKDWRPGRKIGHVNMSLPLGTSATAEAVAKLRSDAQLAATFLVGAIWSDGWRG